VAEPYTAKPVFCRTKSVRRRAEEGRGSKIADGMVHHRPTDARLARWLATLPGPTVKAALFLGLALICVTWLSAGYYFTRRMAELQSRATAISERYMRGQELLTTVRSQVLVGSVYVRDALLDPDRNSADEYRLKLEDAYQTADQALQQYEPVLNIPAERDRILNLRADIGDFRTTVLNVLATDSSQWPLEARNLLRREIMPKREGVIRVTDEVQALNRSGFIQQQNDLAAVYRLTQRRLWESFGAAVLVSVGIALLAFVYVGRLEDRIQRQRITEGENARDLQRLSMKLITAQEEERRVIARELHDEVGQALTAIKMELAVAERQIQSAGGAAGILDDARAISEGVLSTVRDLSHLLHPSLLDDLGLVAAVDSYLKGFTRRQSVQVDLVTERMTERLQPETEVTVYRIVQEALTNVAKHARASSCRVYLQRLANTLLVTVEDDGRGFDLTASDRADTQHRLGLIGIRERVTRLGGSLLLESAAGKGTRLTVELPVRPGADVPESSGPEPEPLAAKPALHEVLGG
jgi:signal transduction histidine kinase